MKGTPEVDAVMSPLWAITGCPKLPNEQYNRIYEAVEVLMARDAGGMAQRMVAAIRAALDDARAPEPQKIEQLPNAKMSPRTLLAQVMEDADNISAVFVVVRSKATEEAPEGGHSACWSNCSIDVTSTAARYFDSVVTDLLRGRHDDLYVEEI